MLISRLACTDENEVRAEEKSLLDIQKEFPGLDLRKAELTEKEQPELARYDDVSAQIAVSDVEAVCDARADLRPAQINNVEAVLRKGYGDKLITVDSLPPAGKPVMSLAKVISMTLYSPSGGG